jgi:hypothetical protein
MFLYRLMHMQIIQFMENKGLRKEVSGARYMWNEKLGRGARYEIPNRIL